ncbi:MAG: NAD/NADP octopine/nopaline dehydrogenase family protein [Emergencia sp.]|nr:NAD/NADP octopine/nopaline dehydrogenase family protein [Emergencia sp.]
MSRVTVFGGGNGGMTMAYHLSRNGHEVCVYDFPDYPIQIEGMTEKGGIRALREHDGNQMLLDGFEGNIKGTFDMDEAMEFSDIYIIICPSFAQERFFSAMIPNLRMDAIVITLPGNYASLVFSRMLKEAGKEDLHIHFADGTTIPWACRLAAPAEICIMGLKTSIPLSIYPKDHSGEVLKRIGMVMPIPVELLDNPLVAGLENINIGGHPLYATVNMGLLENFPGKFNYYKDCCSPATGRASERLDKEKISVGEGFGFTVRSDIELVNRLYGMNERNSYEFNIHSSVHGKINNSPKDSKDRYITEDIPYTMVPIHEFADFLNIEVPIADSCIHLASAYNDEDYFKTGRTLMKMGLNGLCREELIRVVSK